MEIFYDIIHDYTIRTVTAGSAILGIISGIAGSFAVLRKQSLLGDAISHAALPGIVLAFILTGVKMKIIFILGALAAGWAATMFLAGIVNYSKIKNDTAMGIILSSFFGLGIVLLTHIQKSQNASQAGIEKYLFGQAAAIVSSDLLIMTIFTTISGLIILLLWKEFKLTAFDAQFARSSGLNIKFLDNTLTAVIVIAIVIGLQTVGVVLMSAMIVAPGAAARQWTDRLGFMVITAGIFGAVSGISGALISAYSSKLPTGPVIIIIISLIVIISILFAPRRGVIYNFIRALKTKSKFKAKAVLLALYELSLQHKNNVYHSHSIDALCVAAGQKNLIKKALKSLKSAELVNSGKDGYWNLTKQGYEKASQIAISIETGFNGGTK